MAIGISGSDPEISRTSEMSKTVKLLRIAGSGRFFKAPKGFISRPNRKTTKKRRTLCSDRCRFCVEIVFEFCYRKISVGIFRQCNFFIGV